MKIGINKKGNQSLLFWNGHVKACSQLIRLEYSFIFNISGMDCCLILILRIQTDITRSFGYDLPHKLIE